MQVGDLVTLWINKKKIGVILSIKPWRWEHLVEVQWTDGTIHQHRIKDLEVISE